MQEWLHVTGDHNKVEFCSQSRLKESGFRSKDLYLALALSLGRGLRRIVGSVTNQLLPYSGVVITDQRPRLSQIVH